MKKYNELNDKKQSASVNEPIASYGDIDILKVKLINRITEMDNIDDLRKLMRTANGESFTGPFTCEEADERINRSLEGYNSGKPTYTVEELKKRHPLKQDYEN